MTSITPLLLRLGTHCLWVMGVLSLANPRIPLRSGLQARCGNPMKYFNITLLLYLLSTLTGVSACEKSPREGVVLYAGTTTLVGGGRTLVTFLDTDDGAHTARVDTLASALFRIKCHGQEHEVSARQGEWTVPLCGVRLLVQDVVRQTLPFVRLTIAWE